MTSGWTAPGSVPNRSGFVERSNASAAWAYSAYALNPGGWLACELFGDRDSQAQDPDVATLTREQVDGLLEPLDVVSLETVELDGMSFTGPHHWHVFTLIARKP